MISNSAVIKLPMVTASFILGYEFIKIIAPTNKDTLYHASYSPPTPLTFKEPFF